MSKSSREVMLEMQVALLRRTLRLVVKYMRNNDFGHILVELDRPRQTFKAHINRVIRDTRPYKEQ